MGCYPAGEAEVPGAVQGTATSGRICNRSPGKRIFFAVAVTAADLGSNLVSTGTDSFVINIHIHAHLHTQLSTVQCWQR